MLSGAAVMEMGNRASVGVWLLWSAGDLTCQDGLVNPQSRWFDWTDADVSRHLVSNCNETQPGCEDIQRVKTEILTSDRERKQKIQFVFLRDPWF